MSFFGKLKQRLFKSSSKIDEGLDAIVSDGGTADAPDEVRAVDPAPLKAPPAEPAAPDPEPTPEVTLAEPVAPDPEPVPDALPPEPVTPEPEPVLQEEPAPPAEPDPVAAPAPSEPDIVTEDPAPPTEKRPGMFARALGALTGGATETSESAAPAPVAPPSAPVVRRVLDDDMLESLEELLITADMGVETSMKVTARLAEDRFGRRVSTDEIKHALAAEVARILEPVARPLPIYAKRPQVVLVVGVNGSGKTTTIGKLASQLKSAGKSVVIAAGDTFRAAAVEQLQVWGERAGVPVLTAAEGADPAALAFDAMVRAEADGADLLMIDTAGRLQNRADLMEELAKIVRVLRRRDPEAPHNTVLVLDATTGQNALAQVDVFARIADVSGLVMTKLDGTAKGGVLVALADRFGLPIHAIGVGEQIDDLAPFDPDEFAAALTGTD